MYHIIVISSDIEPNKSEVPRGKSMPCNHPNCLTCKSMGQIEEGGGGGGEGMCVTYFLGLKFSL